jgi:hypothetical protein
VVGEEGFGGGWIAGRHGFGGLAGGTPSARLVDGGEAEISTAEFLIFGQNRQGRARALEGAQAGLRLGGGPARQGGEAGGVKTGRGFGAGLCLGQLTAGQTEDGEAGQETADQVFSRMQD